MNRKFIDFDAQVCLVTGAGSGSGIGFQTAKILGELGASIALAATTDRIYERARELKCLGITARGYIADLMDRSQTEAMVRKIAEDFGTIHVLINNAGMAQVGQEEDFSNYGRIVNVSSVTGPIVSNPGEAAYSAAKAGIIGMSRALAIEVGKNNITVNNVLPGWIATASQTEGEAQGGLNTPLGRSADATEVANAIVFLASREASYITGESLVVDGGNTIQEYKGDSKFYY